MNPITIPDLSALSAECLALAGELEGKKRRTAEERAALVERARLTLLAAGHRLNPSAAVPWNPEALAGSSLEDAFLDWYERELIALRFQVIQRAADFVLGEKGMAWIFGNHQAEHAAVEMAHTSDEGMREQLRRLNLLAAAKGRDAV